MNDWKRQPADHGAQQQPGYPPPAYVQDPRMQERNKSKWVAGLLAFLVPGTGHFYLGQMVKGIAIMLLIALDICAIVFAATQGMNVLVIVLFSLLLPIIYFYSLFDTLQSTDAVNDKRYQPGWSAPIYGTYRGPLPGVDADSAGQSPAPAAPDFGGPAAATGGPTPASGMPAYEPQGAPRNVSPSAVIFLAAAAVVLFIVADIRWSHWLFKSSGSMMGAVILIGAGIGLWFWEMRGQQGRKG